eukprot:EC123377.1.p1 GENE.EC123377.1~~EC123377.1.p1  ORF type:complete len:168 (+),score=7.40 EC123377.1:2-505(+)
MAFVLPACTAVVSGQRSTCAGVSLHSVREGGSDLKSSFFAKSTIPRFSSTPIWHVQQVTIRTFDCAASATGMPAEKKLPFSAKKPTEAELEQLGVRRWPTWGCGASTFDWSYSEKETCYLLEGDVTVQDSSTGAEITFGAGDLVTFDESLSCVWKVRKPVRKHYKFG